MVMAKKGKLPPKVRPGIYIPTSKATRQTKAETPKPKGRELWASGDIGMIVQVVLPHVHEEDALQLLWKHFTNNDPEIKLDDYWRGVFRERHGWAIKAVLEAANGSD